MSEEKIVSQLARLNLIQATSLTYIMELAGQRDEIKRISRIAWRDSTPDATLTWGKILDGEEFFKAVSDYKGDTQYGRVLEIGPGYGRLLKHMIEKGAVFDAYEGVDLSENNIRYLSSNFVADNVTFHLGDIFEYKPQVDNFDLVIATAVFQHIYPDISELVVRLRSFMKPDALLCFDVPKGGDRFLDVIRSYFIKHYEEGELIGIIERAGYTNVSVRPSWFPPHQRGIMVCASASS